MNDPMAQLGQEDGGYIPSDEEMKAAARRNLAFAVLPSVIRARSNTNAKNIVKFAYQLADEMLAQGIEENESSSD